ncbi:hypothetical protein CPT_Pasto_019 [Rhizobium phage Pasto]|uniref:Uncharacterized protein n=1 Tax=Rhizobium phage Pasto TaxID=2767575 RepID=A0A7S6U1P3_9CAUD|nr:hypothetical protein CPT_Pasto_019 [Rhizobium phage Pasto]
MFFTAEYRKAHLYWAKGEPLPTDLYMALSEQGYDVERLQNKYLK